MKAHLERPTRRGAFNAPRSTLYMYSRIPTEHVGFLHSRWLFSCAVGTHGLRRFGLVLSRSAAADSLARRVSPPSVRVARPRIA